MWFVFPQIAGLGSSPMAQRYAIASIDEARAYLAHPVLGARLRECTQLVLDVTGREIGDILGYPDDLKFRSSMTLFAAVDGAPAIFDAALQQYFRRRGGQWENAGACSASGRLPVAARARTCRLLRNKPHLALHRSCRPRPSRCVKAFFA